MAVAPEFKKGDIITYGEGRGNYADGKGGFVDANPEKPEDYVKDWQPKGEEPTEHDLALFQRYTHGTPEEKAQALLDIQYELGIAGQDDSAGTSANVKLANWLAKNSGHA